MGVDFGVVHEAALGAFGEDVIYTPQGGAPVTVQGIFRKAHFRIDIDSGAPIHSGQPVVDVRLADLPGGVANRGDKVTIGGVTYDVKEPIRDGLGMATLALTKRV